MLSLPALGRSRSSPADFLYNQTDRLKGNRAMPRPLIICLLAVGALAIAQDDAPRGPGGRMNTREFLGLGTPPDQPAATRGEKLYKPNCGFCHGEKARGAEGPNLVRSGRSESERQDQGGEEEAEVPLPKIGRHRTRDRRDRSESHRVRGPPRPARHLERPGQGPRHPAPARRAQGQSRQALRALGRGDGAQFVVAGGSEKTTCR